MTGLRQANIQKQLTEVHVEEIIRDMELAGKAIAVFILISFASLLASFFAPLSIFISAGFLGAALYALLLRASVKKDLYLARKCYKGACDRLEELERKSFRG